MKQSNNPSSPLSYDTPDACSPLDPSGSVLHDFVSTAIRSAETYYTFLKGAKKGREVVRVDAIREIGHRLFELRLDRRIFAADAVAFCASPVRVPPQFYENIEERFVNSDFARICKYDKTVPSLCLDIAKEFEAVFRTLRPEEIVFVSDLTFLVRRVQKWYEEHGAQIRPSLPPTILRNDESALHRRGHESAEQQLAEKTALCEPYAYIWGAPGTGKTQVVLANCILSYIDRKERVYIVAPTNNAIEQVLRAVIRALRDQGRSIDCLYRMGTASEDFVRQYGRICERFDAEAQIDDCNRERERLHERQAEIRHTEHIRRVTATLQEAFLQYDTLKAQMEEYQARLGDMFTRYSEAETEYRQSEQAYLHASDHLQEVIDRQAAASFFVHCRFSAGDRQKASAEMLEAIHTYRHSSQKASAQKARCEELRLEYERVQALPSPSAEKLADYEHAIRDGYLCLSLEEPYESVESAKDAVAHVKLPDQSESEEDLSARIHHLTERIEALEQRQAAEVADRYAFAFTIDHLIGHYDRLPNETISHIFLDEAAYCPMIKAGVLFSLGVPITLLGDHMQLPPICEADDVMIRAKDSGLYLWAQSAVHFPQIFKATHMDELYRTFLSHQAPETDVLPMVPLSKTYRFGRELAAVLDRFVYRTQFEGNESVETSVTVIPVPSPLAPRKGRENADEAEAIRVYIQTHRPADYAVLTPYHDQVKRLQATLAGLTDRNDILTIHRSQGREWDTVIISVSDSVRRKYFTDTSHPRSNGLKIINTAVSRTRKNLVIVCDYERWAALCNEQLIGGIVALPSCQVVSV